jgi:hypothetical protein
LRATCFALLLAVAAAAQPAVAVAECLHFEPAEVQLSGTLTARAFPGPPNYQSVAAGDRADRAFILVLDAPVCVEADLNSEINREAQAGIREVHIRWFEGDLASFVGKHVIVRGQLSTATIGHDRTPVVLDVKDARAG